MKIKNDPPVKPGDEVQCITCNGRGVEPQQWPMGGSTGAAVVCRGCDGSGVQIVQSGHIVAYADR